VVSSDARSASPEPIFAPHEVVRPLGARPNPVYAVRHGLPGGKVQLSVAERFAGLGKAGDEAGALFVREARRISTIASPNLARVREVAVRGDDVVVFGELVDGEKLQTVWPGGSMPLEVALRVVVDALSGASALHTLRDAKQQPMKLAHGEISPATVVLGVDGIARLLHATARRAPGVCPDAASVGHLAPEVHAGEVYDARADVFSAGVLLWEALTGKWLFERATGEERAARARDGALPPATVPAQAPWAKGLVEVAAKALAPSPEDRWQTAAAMAAEIRKCAGLKLASASTAGAYAKGALGASVKARREALEGGAGTQTPAPAPAHAPVPALAPAPAAAPAPAPKVVIPAGFAPPTSAPASPEPELEAPSVLVAPGVSAPVSEVIELGSDVDLEVVPESQARPASAPVPPSPPPAPVAARPEPSPAPVAAREGPPPVPAQAPERTPPGPPAVRDDPPPSGAPYYSAAIDLPAPAVAAVPAAVDTEPSLARRAAEDDARERANRRRKAFVLGGVGLLGLAVFVLAAWRVAHRGADAATSPPSASALSVATTAARPSNDAPPPSAPATTSEPTAAVAPPAAAAPAPPSVPSPAVSHHAHSPPHTKHAGPARHPKKHSKSKPTFDPNSL